MYVLKELQPTLFGTRVYINDYFLLVNPSRQIAEDVIHSKKELAQLVGPYDAENSLPHISLLRFHCIAEYENKLLNMLQAFSGAHQKIQLQFNKFNQFDSSRTLFLDISDKDPLLKFQRELVLWLKLNMKGLKIAKMGFNPHLTIGKNLLPHQFVKAVESFTVKPYLKSFLCNHLTLLRRAFDYRNEKEYWMKVCDMPLGRVNSDLEFMNGQISWFYHKAG